MPMSKKKSAKVWRKDWTPCKDRFNEDSLYSSIAKDKQCLASSKDVALIAGFPVSSENSFVLDIGKIGEPST